jgi:hypothetical protein
MKLHVNPCLLVAAAIACAGCSGSDPTKTLSAAPASKSPAQSELETKLGTMSPEERSKYVQDHPDEFRSAYGVVGPASSPGGK